MLNHHGSLELPECNLSLEAQVATGIAVVRRARLARNASKNCSSTVPLSRSPSLNPCTVAGVRSLMLEHGSSHYAFEFNLLRIPGIELRGSLLETQTS